MRITRTVWGRYCWAVLLGGILLLAQASPIWATLTDDYNYFYEGRELDFKQKVYYVNNDEYHRYIAIPYSSMVEAQLARFYETWQEFRNLDRTPAARHLYQPFNLFETLRAQLADRQTLPYYYFFQRSCGAGQVEPLIELEKDCNGTIVSEIVSNDADQVITREVPVDGTVTKLYFVTQGLFGKNDPVYPTIIRPSGTVLVGDDPDVRYWLTPFVHVVEVTAPDPGQWRLTISSPGTYMIRVSCASNLVLNPLTEAVTSRPQNDRYVVQLSGLSDEIQNPVVNVSWRQVIGDDTLTERLEIRQMEFQPEHPDWFTAVKPLTEGLYLVEYWVTGEDADGNPFRRLATQVLALGQLGPRAVYYQPNGPVADNPPRIQWRGIVEQLGSDFEVTAQVDGQPIPSSAISVVPVAENAGYRIELDYTPPGQFSRGAHSVKVAQVNNNSYQGFKWGFSILSGPAGNLRINEVYAGSGFSEKWVELTCTEGAVDLSENYHLTTMDQYPAKLCDEPLTIRRGEYAVVHFKTGESDSDRSGDRNGNGVKDLYVPMRVNRIDDCLLLKHWDVTVDAVFWANGDGKVIRFEGNDLKYAAERQMWPNTAGGEGDFVIIDSNWSSIGRPTAFQDHDNREDWCIQAYPTPGRPNAGPQPPAGAVVINEIQPCGETTEEGDWVELLVKQGPLNVGALHVHTMDGDYGPTYPEGALFAPTGAYVLIHWQQAGVNETDQVGDANGNGCIDLYPGYPGLNQTADEVVVTTGDRILDAVVYAQPDQPGEKAAEWKDAFQLVTEGEWSGNFSENDNFNAAAMLLTSNQSLGRLSDGADDNRAGDWVPQHRPSPGRANAPVSPPDPGAVVINEVYPNEFFGRDHDWAELYCVSGPVDIGPMVLNDCDGLEEVLAAGPVTLNPGEYAVVHWEQGPELVDETDGVGDRNGNGYRDLYVSGQQLFKTDDQLTLKWGTSVLDAVIWSNMDQTLPEYETRDNDQLVALHQWLPEAGELGQAIAVDLKGGFHSIGRVPNAVDTDRRADWGIVHESPGRSNEYQDDILAPLCSLVIGPPKYATETDTYLSALSFLSLVAFDDVSGVEQITYAVDESDFQVYETPFTIDAEGQHQFRWTATDYAGHQGEWQAQVWVDNTAPVATMVTPAAGGVYGQSQTIPLNVTANDNLSGVYSTDYYLDGMRVEPGASLIGRTIVPGPHQLTVEATDQVRNHRTDGAGFSVIDDLPPSPPILAADPYPTAAPTAMVTIAAAAGCTVTLSTEAGELVAETLPLTEPTVLALTAATVTLTAADTIIHWPLMTISDTNLARIELIPSSPTGVTTEFATLVPGLRREVFEGTQFDRFLAAGVDPIVDADYSTGGPLPGGPDDFFSIRWSGYLIAPQTGTYELSCYTNDRAALWLNGVQVFNTLENPEQYNSGQINLMAGGCYPLVIEYSENSGTAHIAFRWKPPYADTAETVQGAFLITPTGGFAPVAEIANVELTGTNLLVRSVIPVTQEVDLETELAGCAVYRSAPANLEVPLADGENRFQARAQDSHGNLSAWSLPITVTRDRVTPQLLNLTVQPEQFSPDGDGRYDTAALTFIFADNLSGYPGSLTVTVTDPSGTPIRELLRAVPASYREWIVIWDGMNGEGTAVGAGTYQLTIHGTDAAGNPVQAETAVTIQYDVTPPEIAVSSPLDGSAHSYTQTLTLAWTITDTESGVAISSATLDGITVSNGQVIELRILGVGPHTLTIIASDNAGNATTATIPFAVIDDIPPVIELAQPVSPTNQTVTLQYVIYDEITDTAHLMITGDRSPYAAAGSYTETVTVADAAGNHASASVSFVIDLNPPTLILTQPATPTNQDVLLAYTVSDDYSPVEKITVTGQQVYTAEGNYTGIILTATDEAGNSAAGNAVDFVIDRTAPAVTVVSPQSGASYSYTALLTVGYAADDTGSGVGTIVALLDGETVASGTSLNLKSLGIGTHTLSVTGIDNAGNQTATSSSFTVIDDVPPVIELVAPPVLTNQNVILHYMVYDEITDTAQLIVTGDNSPYIADGEYNVTVAVRDAAGNSASASATFVIDKGAPVVALQQPLTPTSQSVTLAYTVSDNHSSETGIVVNGQRVFDAEGVYDSVILTAVDEAGNVGTSNPVSFVIDRTAPVITVAAPTAGTVYSYTLALVLDYAAQDPGCGVAALAAVIDGNAVENGQTINLRTLGIGSHLLTVTATDNAGNTGTAAVPFTVIDDVPPTITVTQPTTPTNQNVTLSYTAYDEISDTAHLTISGNRSPYTVEGAYTVVLTATDEAGNQATSNAVAFTIDKTAPTTLLTIGTPNYNDFISASTPITLSATDNLAGVATTSYRLDAGAWQAYAGSFTIAVDGAHTIGYRSEDAAGNIEAEKTRSLTVDGLAPVSILSADLTDSTGTIAVPETKITIAATDAGCGVQKIEYRVNSGAWVTYGAPFELRDVAGLGSVTIGYRAVDQLGNAETEKTVSYTVKKALELNVGLLTTPRVLCWWNEEWHGQGHPRRGAWGAVLSALLDTVALDYEVVEDRDDFLDKLNDYNVYVIVGDKRQLSTAGDSLVAGQVALGKTIISFGYEGINTPDRHDQGWENIFGIRVSGTLSGPRRLYLAPSPLSEEGEAFLVSGDVEKVTQVDGGEVWAEVGPRHDEHGNGHGWGHGGGNNDDDSYPVIIANTWGAGKTVYLALEWGKHLTVLAELFDREDGGGQGGGDDDNWGHGQHGSPLAERYGRCWGPLRDRLRQQRDDEHHGHHYGWGHWWGQDDDPDDAPDCRRNVTLLGEMLQNLVQWSAPAQEVVRPGGVVGIGINVKNSVLPLVLRVNIESYLPTGSDAITVYDGGEDRGSYVVWFDDLPENVAHDYRFLLRLPTSPIPVTVSVEAAYLKNGVYRTVERIELPIQ